MTQKPEKPRIMGGARQPPHIIIVACKGLRLGGVLGNTELTLEEIAAKLPRRMEGVEAFPIQRSSERHHLPAFSFEPPMKIAFTRSGNWEGTTLMTLSLNDRNLSECIRRIAGIVGIREYLYYPSFEEELLAGRNSTTEYYDYVLQLSELYGTSLRRAFGMHTYADLLTMHRELSEEDATLTAKKRFGMSQLPMDKRYINRRY